MAEFARIGLEASAAEPGAPPRVEALPGLGLKAASREAVSASSRERTTSAVFPVTVPSNAPDASTVEVTLIEESDLEECDFEESTAQEDIATTAFETSASDGQERAFSSLDWGQVYEAHADFVWRCLRRMGLSPDDSKDALHEVFLIVHRRCDAFDPRLGSVKGWLFGITANVVRAERRRKKPILQDATLESWGASGQNPGDCMSENSRRASDGLGGARQRDLRSALRSAISSLSPEHRAVFTMYEVEGIDGGVIAEELGIPVGTVYSRLHNARNSLRQLLATYKSGGGPA